ncbi:glycosyltransferase family 2 protein [Candidatus Falkowbacteria bacterium CG10_big_fil_rev_8_21_14_0_10_37_14]|uniref:Glycosyltransferase family 2 protein n=1 Tax=Candidatus Falkowbacteria bacterium CG10_big_fil_rev_8_21_14_0_10_37_14 TaxID=1974561 RepID=A0A2M6WUE0_9BACT|nr:glycosyltransferase family 2 protein [Candidatus Falkowbacteria bacterium]PIT96423.1 MAG: glycosyltransferase family 2 protein [Candidatus Falkowbacteria bacterium CG10_big_fil_rev_8_21_14_0_10_37_14]
MLLSIIIVSWKSKEVLKINLRSLSAALESLDAEVFVVDNASKDGTVEMIKKHFSWVKLIANKENIGFARANNLALSQSKGRYLLLLNPDMKLRPNTLTAWLDWLEANPQAAISGPRLVNEYGGLIHHVRRFPTILDQTAIALKLPHLSPHILDSYLARDFDYSKSARVDSIRGACFMIRRFAYEKLGGLDERFFVWFEEVDYCQRAKAIGLQVWYTPVAVAIDYVGQSFKLISRGRAQSYFRQSMLKYFIKWHSPIEVILLRLAWFIGRIITSLAIILKLESKTKT